MTIAPEEPRNPLVPRPIDLPTPVPLSGPLDVLDGAKIMAAPDDPSEWPDWRDALRRWRTEAATRVIRDDRAYGRPEFEWTRRCFAVALVWLWDELLYDHEARRFVPERFCDDAQRQFGGFDGVVLWHAYPVIGIDERNQFDFYRDVQGLGELVEAFHERDVRVFVDYNPWDTGTRREPVGDEEAIARLVGELGVDGVFLDTMKEARPGLRAAVDAVRAGVAFEGESVVSLERISDHHLSWAQWFADSPVPGVMRARWYEQRHMLHHTRRWNRDHSEELRSAWLNGTGVLVWENVFGSWVGWNARDKALLKGMLSIQRPYADLLATGDWTPLAGHSGGHRPAVVASRWTDGSTTLWAAANTRDEPFTGSLTGADVELTIPARGIAAVIDGQQVMSSPADESDAFPVRLPVRVPAPSARSETIPAGYLEVSGPPARISSVFRRRETGTYEGAPYVEEWKPLPPRLHDFVEVERATAAAPRFAISRREVTNAEFGADGPPDAPATGVDLEQARAYAAAAGARLPTEDEWQLAAEAGLLQRAEPLVWNWTESEHSDGRTRFVILKGGSAWRAEESDWYVDGGPQDARYSLKLLLLGADLARSSQIGFRLAVDLS
jgi:hypothetical protein